MPRKNRSRQKTERVGIYAVGEIFERDFQWIFREQPICDYGIDAHAEVCEEVKGPTGRLFALQIKSGESYFRSNTSDGIKFKFDSDHLEYWTQHSLPVVVVLYNTKSRIAYWQSVKDNAIINEKGNCHIIIPHTNVLNEHARQKLIELTDIPQYQKRLNQLLIHKPWIQLLNKGNRLFLEAEEWINKSSGRGSLKLILYSKFGRRKTIRDWPFVMFPGISYIDVFPRLFPWADISIDEDFYSEYDEAEFDSECGIWDSEDDRYIGHTDNFVSWRKKLSDIRPYDIAMGEVAKFRLELRLNSLSSSYIILDKYLSTGELDATPKHGRVGLGYNYGLKTLASSILNR